MNDTTNLIFARMADAIKYLSKDSGRCFSRYGRWSDDCAPYAFLLSLIHATHGSGEPIGVDSLEGSMSLVVNDHDDVRYMIENYGASLGWHDSNGWTLDDDDELIPSIDDEWLGKAYVQYVETLLWSDQWYSEDGETTIPLDDLFVPQDIKPEDHKTLKAELRDFCEGSWDDLFDMEPEQAGHDFALTRNGHGAGFWDRGLGAQGDRLTEACRPYGEQSLSEYLPEPDPQVLADYLENNQ